MHAPKATFPAESSRQAREGRQSKHQLPPRLDQAIADLCGSGSPAFHPVVPVGPSRHCSRYSSTIHTAFLAASDVPLGVSRTASARPSTFCSCRRLNTASQPARSSLHLDGPPSSLAFQTAPSWRGLQSESSPTLVWFQWFAHPSIASPGSGYDSATTALAYEREPTSSELASPATRNAPQPWRRRLPPRLLEGLGLGPGSDIRRPPAATFHV